MHLCNTTIAALYLNLNTSKLLNIFYNSRPSSMQHFIASSPSRDLLLVEPSTSGDWDPLLNASPDATWQDDTGIILLWDPLLDASPDATWQDDTGIILLLFGPLQEIFVELEQRYGFEKDLSSVIPSKRVIF
jgi:hypothetical protein